MTTKTEGLTVPEEIEIVQHMLERLRRLAEIWPQEPPKRGTTLRDNAASVSIYAYIEAIARDPLLFHALSLRHAECMREQRLDPAPKSSSRPSLNEHGTEPIDVVAALRTIIDIDVPSKPLIVGLLNDIETCGIKGATHVVNGVEIPQSVTLPDGTVHETGYSDPCPCGQWRLDLLTRCWEGVEP